MQRSVTIRLWNAYNIGPIVTNDPSACVHAVLLDVVSSDAARERRPTSLRDPVFLRSVNFPEYLASEGEFGRGGNARSPGASSLRGLPSYRLAAEVTLR